MMIQEESSIRRSKRVKELSQFTRLGILEELNNTRTYINQFHAKVRPFGSDYVALCRINQAIDDLAEEWTGDNTYFHAKTPTAGE